MAKIKKSSKQNTIALVENPWKNTVYIEGDGFNKNTLAPLFDAPMIMSKGSTAVSGYTLGQGNYARNNDGNTYNIRMGMGGWTGALAKETAYCIQNQSGTGNDRQNNVEFYHMMSIDPDNKHSFINRIYDDNDQQYVDIWNIYSTKYNKQYVRVWSNNSAEFHITEPGNEYSYGGNTSNDTTYQGVWPVTKETGSDYISWITKYMHYGSYSHRPMYALGRTQFTAAPNGTDWDLTSRNVYTIQYIGKSSVDGKPLYLYNKQDNDYQQYVTRHNVSSNNTTDLHYFSGAPSAAGTSYGGARANTSIGNVIKMASTSWDVSANVKGFYLPYFDTSLNYHPFYYTWDTTTDTFTRNEDITITGDLSSTHFNSIRGGQGDHSDEGTVIWNEWFVSNGTRYLTMMQATAFHQTSDASALSRTYVTYSVDASDPKQLTHHSATIIPATPRQVLFLNDARTIMGVFLENSFLIYTWNDTNGWELTSTIIEKFHMVGRDSTDRIWAVASSGDGYTASYHVLTPTIPTKITIDPASSSYDYQGSNINSTVNISAYNINNERIAVDVALSIDGSTMTFGDGGTTATITTSTTGETSQAIIITGAGLSDIIANVQV